MSHQSVALVPKFWSDILSTSLLKGVRHYIANALHCWEKLDPVKSVDLGIWQAINVSNVMFLCTLLHVLKFFTQSRSPFLHTSEWNQHRQTVTKRNDMISHYSSVLEFASSEAINIVLSFALKLYLIHVHACISISMSSRLWGENSFIRLHNLIILYCVWIFL